MRRSVIVLAAALTLVVATAGCGDESDPARSSIAAADGPLTPTDVAPRIRCAVEYRQSVSRPKVQRSIVKLDTFGTKARRTYRDLVISLTRNSDAPGDGHLIPAIYVRISERGAPLHDVLYLSGFYLPDWAEQNLVNQIGDNRRSGITGRHQIVHPQTGALVSYSCWSLDAVA